MLDTQTKTRQLNQYAARTGLRINKKKTQVLRINSKCENRILIDDQELKEVDKYNYLGANVITLISKEEAVMTLLTGFVKLGYPS